MFLYVYWDQTGASKHCCDNDGDWASRKVNITEAVLNDHGLVAASIAIRSVLKCNSTKHELMVRPRHCNPISASAAGSVTELPPVVFRS